MVDLQLEVAANTACETQTEGGYIGLYYYMDRNQPHSHTLFVGSPEEYEFQIPEDSIRRGVKVAACALYHICPGPGHDEQVELVAATINQSPDHIRVETILELHKRPVGTATPRFRARSNVLRPVLALPHAGELHSKWVVPVAATGRQIGYAALHELPDGSYLEQVIRNEAPYRTSETSA